MASEITRTGSPLTMTDTVGALSVKNAADNWYNPGMTVVTMPVLRSQMNASELVFTASTFHMIVRILEAGRPAFQTYGTNIEH